MCRTISKVHYTSRFFMYNCSFSAAQAQQKLHAAYLTIWHNIILGYKLQTD